MALIVFFCCQAGLSTAPILNQANSNSEFVSGVATGLRTAHTHHLLSKNSASELKPVTFEAL
jgi:hypothetical protein